MKKSTKAAVYSALICPGAGHFLLKRRALGFLWVVPTVAASLYILVTAIRRAVQLIFAMPVPANPFDLNAVLKLSAAARVTDDPWVTASWVVIGVCWVVATVHAYLLGKQLEEQAPAAAERGAL